MGKPDISGDVPGNRHGREVKRVKKALSNEALLKEAAFWTTIKKATETNPTKSCLK